MYMIHRATNLKEYADSIYLTISQSSAALNFAFVTWKMAEIFRFIDKLEDIVNISKCHTGIKLTFSF